MNTPSPVKLNVRSLLLLVLSLSTLVVNGVEKETGKDPVASNVATDAPPEDWMEWAKWAEKRQQVTDPQGHGPDIGSDEWAAALGWKLKISDKAIRSKEWRAAVEKTLAPDTQRKLLSSHDTEARFEGLKDHRCLGRTSLCPDRCGHSGKLATFAIVKYLGYEKPGEYGDPKQERFQILIEDNMKNPKVPAAIHKTISALTPGALVHLQWNHDYVTRAGSSFPERKIRELSIINDK